jgi:hypothetical protein
MRCFWHASDSLLQHSALWALLPQWTSVPCPILRMVSMAAPAEAASPHDEVTAIVLLAGVTDAAEEVGGPRGAVLWNAVSLSLYGLCSVVGSLTSSIGARRCAPCSLPCLACVGTNSQPHGLAHAFLDVERREESQRSAAQHRAGSPRCRCRPAACKRAPSAAGAQPWLRAACPLVSGRYFSFLAAFPSSSLVYIANLALLTTTLPSSGALP